MDAYSTSAIIAASIGVLVVVIGIITIVFAMVCPFEE